MPHNHLLINHLPVFATLFGIIFLLVGFVLNNSTLRIAALATLLVGGFSFLPSNFTGDQAHEVLEHRKDFDKTSHHLMHEHEEAAEFATPFGLGMAVLALAGIIFEARQNRQKAATNAPAYGKIISGLAGVVALVVMWLLAGVANSGGEIRHPEIRKEATASPAETGKTTKDDD